MGDEITHAMGMSCPFCWEDRLDTEVRPILRDGKYILWYCEICTRSWKRRPGYIEYIDLKKGILL